MRFLAVTFEKIRDRFEYHVVTVAAAIESDHENDGAPQYGCRTHRTRGQIRALAQDRHAVDGFIAERAIAQHADERATVQTFGDDQHRVDVGPAK